MLKNHKGCKWHRQNSDNLRTPCSLYLAAAIKLLTSSVHILEWCWPVLLCRNGNALYQPHPEEQPQLHATVEHSKYDSCNQEIFFSFLVYLISLHLSSYMWLVTTVSERGSLKHELLLTYTLLLCHTWIEQALGELWIQFLCLLFSHSFLKFINDF